MVNASYDTNNDTKTTSSIAIKLGISSRTIKRDLKVLQDLGYIEHCILETSCERRPLDASWLMLQADVMSAKSH